MAKAYDLSGHGSMPSTPEPGPGRSLANAAVSSAPGALMLHGPALRTSRSRKERLKPLGRQHGPDQTCA
jgi:hypothetical protein